MADESRPFEDPLVNAFEELNYPVENESELTPNIPSWASTRFEAGDFSLTPRELPLFVPDNYPYENVDEFVSGLRSRLREAGYLD